MYGSAKATRPKGIGVKHFTGRICKMYVDGVFYNFYFDTGRMTAQIPSAQKVIADNNSPHRLGKNDRM